LLSTGVNDVVRELRAEKELDGIPILVFAREGTSPTNNATETLDSADDWALVGFVEKQR
jgi:hypothetical protein